MTSDISQLCDSTVQPFTGLEARTELWFISSRALDLAQLDPRSSPAQRSTLSRALMVQNQNAGAFQVREHLG